MVVDILSADATLKNLLVNNTAIPGFDPQVTEYACTVGCDLESADIIGIPNHGNATVINRPNVHLETGDNRYSILVTAENGFTTKTYTVNVIRDCYVPKIIKDLEDAIICLGESHTFQVLAEGHNLSYEWYYGNQRIRGANKSSYTVSHGELKDYERYYVIIRSQFNGYKASTYSKNVRLWVSENLPQRLVFSHFPDRAITGKSYRIKLDGYADVTQYKWSYDRDGVSFTPETGATGENETWATFGTLSEGLGRITVSLEHPCGARQVSRTVEVKYPTGSDRVATTGIRISPNPTSGLITVWNTQPGQTIRITDLTGSLKGTYPAQDNTTAIDLTGYAKGSYIVQYGSQVFKILRK